MCYSIRMSFRRFISKMILNQHLPLIEPTQVKSFDDGFYVYPEGFRFFQIKQLSD